MSVNRTPADSEVALSEYRDIFDGNRVSPEIVDGVLEAVRRWNSRRIKIFGFRPPTVPEMVAVENLDSGFDGETFVRRFESNGGVWLRIPQYAYPICDGSHIAEPDAPRFSADLAALIKLALNAR